MQMDIFIIHIVPATSLNANENKCVAIPHFWTNIIIGYDSFDVSKTKINAIFMLIPLSIWQ